MSKPSYNDEPAIVVLSKSICMKALFIVSIPAAADALAPVGTVGGVVVAPPQTAAYAMVSAASDDVEFTVVTKLATGATQTSEPAKEIAKKAAPSKGISVPMKRMTGEDTRKIQAASRFLHKKNPCNKDITAPPPKIVQTP